MNYLKKLFIVIGFLGAKNFIYTADRAFYPISDAKKRTIVKEFNSFLTEMRKAIEYYNLLKEDESSLSLIVKNDKIFSSLKILVYSVLSPFDSFLNKFQAKIPQRSISYDELLLIIQKALPLVGQMPYVFAKKFIYFANKVDPKTTIDPKEKQQVISSIRTILPSLADQLTSFSDVEHIKCSQIVPFGGAFVAIASDGLPEINISRGFMALPEKEVQFTLAHELAHYFLGHHRQMEPNLTMDNVFPVNKSSFPRSDRSNFSPHSLFESAYTRTQESEADRFAITILRADIDAAQSFLSKIGYSQELNILLEGLAKGELKPLLNTHPSSLERAKNLESLRHVFSIPSFVQASDNYKRSLNWEQLKASWLDQSEGYPEYLLERALKNGFSEEAAKAEAMIAARSEKD